MAGLAVINESGSPLLGGRYLEDYREYYSCTGK